MSDSPKTDPLFEKALQNLKRFWGFDSFRPGQDKAVQSVLDGKETVVLFPTGGGKSLCYQVPATVLDGLTIVISPLVALMEDQVEQLRARSVPATFINSTIHSHEIEQRLVNARNGMYRLLYCAPERLATPLFQHELLQLNVAMIAVDEAHCISEWGHDFRPSYREIRQHMEPAGDGVRWLALTATATPEVREDIISVLKLEQPNIISRGFDRPNLKWWVYGESNRNQAVMRMVQKSKGSGLIYAGTRRGCETWAEQIQEITGKKTKPYHAGLSSEQRTMVQEQWISGKIPLVVATNAFGMGIDKPDCRYVIHIDPPATLEAYYQEAGRAGRDGKPAYPMLCLRNGDIKRIEKQILTSYPDFLTLQKVYIGLCDYFDLAEGSGMEKSEPVDLSKVAKRSGIEEKQVLSGLKVLDRLGIIQLSDEREERIGLRFLISIDDIRSYESQSRNERKNEFVKDLFRQYGTESVNEMIYLPISYISEKTDLPPNRIIMGMDVLQNEKIIQFRKTGQQPLVYLTGYREKKPPFGRHEVEHYRNILLAKLRHMEGYAVTDDCRSRYLRMYFGEDNPPACGNCDNCQKISKKPEIPESGLTESIAGILNGNPATAVHISRETGLNGMEVYRILQWMIKEGMVQFIRGKNGAVFSMKNQK